MGKIKEIYQEVKEQYGCIKCESTTSLCMDCDLNENKLDMDKYAEILLGRKARKSDEKRQQKK